MILKKVLHNGQRKHICLVLYSIIITFTYYYSVLYCSPLNGHVIIRRYTVAVTGSVVKSLSNRSTNNTLNFPTSIPCRLSNCVTPEHEPEALFLHSFPSTYRGELCLGAAIISFPARFCFLKTDLLLRNVQMFT